MQLFLTVTRNLTYQVNWVWIQLYSIRNTGYCRRMCLCVCIFLLTIQYIYKKQCTVHSIQYTVHSLQYRVYNYTVYRLYNYTVYRLYNYTVYRL